MKIDGNQYF
ncbi:hypothetical protein CAEBREN_13318 [Caenorhabditis brenneri]|uniref:Uncharacterized protein n=1 Tax=Caenorhabditis brenneri TaxID=135651 RepID=G0MJT8_CAEBE|nr:hypothetical protein CAEBREN_13318 [Caenorhabditis brenneri]